MVLQSKKIKQAVITSMAIGGFLFVFDVSLPIASALRILSEAMNEDIKLEPEGNGRVTVGGDSLVLANLSSDPSSPSAGQIYFNNASNRLRAYNGTRWVTLSTIEFPTGNLVSYWRLDGNGTDSYGSNDLSNQGGASYVSAKIGNGADIESSSNQYFSISDASQSGLDFSDEFSFSWWQKLESAWPGFGTDHDIVYKFSNANHERSYYLRWNNQGSTGMQLLMGTGSSTGNAQVDYTPQTGTFEHIVVTYDAGTMELWVNGALRGTANGTLPTSVYNDTNPFQIGRSGGATSTIDGVFDEFGAWSRKLSPGEIANLYSNGDGLAY